MRMIDHIDQAMAMVASGTAVPTRETTLATRRAIWDGVGAFPSYNDMTLRETKAGYAPRKFPPRTTKLECRYCGSANKITDLECSGCRAPVV